MRIRRLSHLLLILLLLAGVAPGPARAHEPQVFDPGPVELDLGRLIGARLLHVTLERDDDELVVQLTGSNVAVELLVPDRRPERAAAAAELPRLRTGPGLIELDDPRPVVDEVTGIAYQRIASTVIGGDTTIRVKRGALPARAALLVAARNEPFATNDPRRIPRTLTKLRQWYETPAPGSRSSSAAVPERGAAPSPAIVWFGAALGLVGVLIAAWWMRRGRAASRTRGVERTHQPDDD